MSNNIDWKILPYDHSGRWEKKHESKLAPGEKCTWPQWLVEFVVMNRAKFFPEYRVTIGKGWSVPISKEVRALNQQMCTICNYFPHPDDENIVYKVFNTYFKQYHPFKIGTHRKVRVTKDGKCNVTQCEKDVIKGLMYLYSKFKSEDKQVVQPVNTQTNTTENNDPTYRTTNAAPKKNSVFANIIENEKIVDKIKEENEANIHG